MLAWTAKKKGWERMLPGHYRSVRMVFTVLSDGVTSLESYGQLDLAILVLVEIMLRKSFDVAAVCSCSSV